MNAGLGTGTGKTIIGDYDLSFTIDTDFTFSGGGLIIDFSASQETLNNSPGSQNLVESNPSDTSGFFVERYYGASTAGNTSGDGVVQLNSVANFQVESSGVSAVPVPSAVWLFGSGLIGLVGFARRKA